MYNYIKKAKLFAMTGRKATDLYPFSETAGLPAQSYNTSNSLVQGKYNE